MNNSILIGSAFVTGALVPLQLAFNAQLGGVTKSPFTAGLIVFIVGTAAVAAIVIALRPPLPAIGDLVNAPKTIWLGGLIAAFYILAIVVLTPRLGVGLTTALILAGQLFTAMLLDHFGVFGNPQHSLNLWRIGGMLMMVGGVAAIKTH